MINLWTSIDRCFIVFVIHIKKFIKNVDIIIDSWKTT